MTTPTTTNDRAADARLHKLLGRAPANPFRGMGQHDSTLPHYHTSHDAIHHAEDALPAALQREYARELQRATCEGWALVIPAGAGSICTDGFTFNFDTMFSLLHATPSQRATAMLSVLERAREGK